jgi:protein-S-isoprenylcysteine O-methyltransferase Ste14
MRRFISTEPNADGCELDECRLISWLPGLLDRGFNGTVAGKLRGWEGRTSKITAVLGSALFFVVAPAMLAGLIPWSITHWEFRPPFLAVEATRLAGVAFIIAGVPGVLDSFARFALQGLGTPAPIAPPRNLVVSGLYRYVRNPIYVALVAVILGQAVLFADWRLLVYGALLWLFFHIVVIAFEEPTLRESFGAEYESYRVNVPRWLPRLTPWRAV